MECIICGDIAREYETTDKYGETVTIMACPICIRDIDRINREAFERENIRPVWSVAE